MNNSDLKKLSGGEPGEIDAPLKFFDSLFEGSETLADGAVLSVLLV